MILGMLSPHDKVLLSFWHIRRGCTGNWRRYHSEKSFICIPVSLQSVQLTPGPKFPATGFSCDVFSSCSLHSQLQRFLCSSSQVYPGRQGWAAHQDQWLPWPLWHLTYFLVRLWQWLSYKTSIDISKFSATSGFMLQFSHVFLSNNLLIAIRGSRALAQSFAGKAPVKNRCWGGEYQEGRVKEPVLSQQMVTNTLMVILPAGLLTLSITWWIRVLRYNLIVMGTMNLSCFLKFLQGFCMQSRWSCWCLIIPNILCCFGVYSALCRGTKTWLHCRRRTHTDPGTSVSWCIVSSALSEIIEIIKLSSLRSRLLIKGNAFKTWVFCIY